MFPRVCLLVLLFGAWCQASSLTAQGHASAPCDRAVVMLFMRIEAHPDGSEQQQLENNWKEAKTWLNNFGVKDEQIVLRPVVARLFQDQKRYALKRLAITFKIDGDKGEEDLNTIAQLVDQASARGMYPVSQMMMLAAEPESVALPSPAISDAANHFIFFVPADGKKLVEDAVRDAIAAVRKDSARLAGAAHVKPPKMKELHLDTTAFVPMDVASGQLGMASTTFGLVHAYIPVTADFEPYANTPAQAITVNGSAHVSLPAQTGTIQARVSCPDASLQKALARIGDKTKQYDDIARANGAAVEMGGIAFFSGNPGMGSAEPVEGAVPAGVYRDIRMTLSRKDDEAEDVFRKRIEKLAMALHPAATPENGGNLNDNPYFQVTWTAKDSDAQLAKLTEQAVTDATAHAQHSALLIPGKLGGILDLDLSVNESPVQSIGPTGQNSFATLPAPADHLAAVHLDDSPGLTVSVTARFAAEIP